LKDFGIKFGFLKIIYYIHIMAKRLSREEKWDKAVVDLINKMFEIAGHNVTYNDVKGRQDDWYSQWTMTVEQNEEWCKWGKKYLMKELKLYAAQAEKEMSWGNLMWGLKVSN
jgi:hypothetical protein